MRKDKAINALLFVVNSLKEEHIQADPHRIYKILYFAEQKHIVDYGRTIFADRFIKMEYGPVPSFIRDVVEENKSFKVVEKENPLSLIGLKKTDLDYLSESEIEALQESINENKNLSFQDLVDKSHKYAYNKAIMNRPISTTDIAVEAGASEEELNYIEFNLQAESIIWE